MEAYQDRVVTEKAELDEKISKLLDFQHSVIYPTLSDDERSRLIRQFVFMNEYSRVLGERIANFV